MFKVSFKSNIAAKTTEEQNIGLSLSAQDSIKSKTNQNHLS